jgi:hypothetical protein
MPATTSSLTAGEITLLRAGNHTVKRHLSVAPLYVVATARINQASFTKPLAQLTVDNTSAGWGNIRKGFTVAIGTTAGARDIGVFRTRGIPGASTLYIQELSTGDFGLLPLADLADFADNAYITVYANPNIYSVFSRIAYSGGVDSTSGTFYKDYDYAYGTENESTPYGYVNDGQHRAGWVDPSTGVMSVAFDTNAVPWIGTPSSYNRTMYSLTGGSYNYTSGSSSSQNPTIEFEAGAYLSVLDVNYSTGVAQTAWRYIFAHDPDDYPPLDIQISSDRRDVSGRRMRVRTLTASSAALAGQLCVYWEDAVWNGDTVGTATTQFVGWVQDYDGDSRPNEVGTEYEIVSSFEILKTLRAFGQQIVVKADPTTWTEVTSSLAHLDFWVWYLLFYHTTCLDLHDYNVGGVSAYYTQAWSTEAKSLFEQINTAGARLNAHIGQASDGGIFVRRDPNMLSQTARDLKITRHTFTEADIATASAHGRTRPTVGNVYVNGFSFDGSTLTPYQGIAPGYVGGQGSQPDRLENQLVLNASAQSELNERALNRFAFVNRPIESITLFSPLNYDVIEPAEWYWIALDIDAAYWHTAETYSGRALVTSVTITHKEDGQKETTFECIPETTGVAATAQTIYPQLPPADSGLNTGIVTGNSYSLLSTTPYLSTGLLEFTPNSYTVSPPPVIEDTDSGGIAYVVGHEDCILRSENFNTSSPSFTTVLSETGKTGRFLTWDGNISSSNLRIWAMIGDGSLYYNSDPEGAGSYVLKQSLAVSGSSPAYLVRKVAGVNDGIVVYVSGGNGSSINLKYSSDTGTTISTTAVATNNGDVPAFDADDFNLGVFVVTANKSVYYTTSYIQASAVILSGLAGVNGTDTITCIRTPYRKLATQALNNDPTAFQFLYATSSGYTAGVTFNTTTGAIIAESDMSIVVGGTSYYVHDVTALSTYGDNTRIVYALAKEVGGGSTIKLFKSTNGGTTWEYKTDVDARHIYITETADGGNGSKLSLAGLGGLWYSNNGGSTLIQKRSSFSKAVYVNA